LRLGGTAQAVGALYRVLPTSLSRRSVKAFWTEVVRNAGDIERLWRGDGAWLAVGGAEGLSARRRRLVAFLRWRTRHDSNV